MICKVTRYPLSIG